jgi:hypothetical protein
MQILIWILRLISRNLVNKVTSLNSAILSVYYNRNVFKQEYLKSVIFFYLWISISNNSYCYKL